MPSPGKLDLQRVPSRARVDSRGRLYLRRRAGAPVSPLDHGRGNARFAIVLVALLCAVMVWSPEILLAQTPSASPTPPPPPPPPPPPRG
jgi:hypothetical protein